MKKFIHILLIVCFSLSIILQNSVETFAATNKDAKKTNEWNICVVFLKNIDAPLHEDGEKVNYKVTMSDEDIATTKRTINRMYSSIPLMSNGLWKIKSIDYFESSKAVTELGTMDAGGYCINENVPCVRKILDKILKKEYKKSRKEYDQIIVVSPLSQIAQTWAGIGGGGYKNIWFCQITEKSCDFSVDEDDIRNIKEAVVIHEVLHCIESCSMGINPEYTVNLHAGCDNNPDKYRHHMDGWFDLGGYYSDYMQGNVYGKGLDKKAYQVNKENKYSTFFSNTKKKAKKKDVTCLSVSAITDQKYKNGQEIKPPVTVMDGKKKLKQGTDYTVTYTLNTRPGLATVIITGKGKYSGNVGKNFKILPVSPMVTAIKSDSQCILSWDNDMSYDKFEISVSYDGSSYKKIAVLSNEDYTYKLNLNSENCKIQTQVITEFKHCTQYVSKPSEEIIPIEGSLDWHFFEDSYSNTSDKATSALERGQELYFECEEEFDQSTFSEAEKYLLEAYELGNKEAAAYIAILYWYAPNGHKDYKKAFKYDLVSAKYYSAINEYNSSIERLGEQYLGGKGVNQDVDKAIHWYEIGANMGDRSCINKLIYIYEGGIETAPDYDKAQYWKSKL